MKILITTHHLKDKAGSELFTRDLSIELKKRGHEIFVFSPTLGNISEEIKQMSIKVTDNLLNFKNQKFDIIHAQHNTTAILVRSVFPHTPMIFMSHGVLPELEQPPSVDLGIYKYLAVSEEVENNLIKQGISKDRVEIVRNFVDTQRFKIINQPNDILRNILVLSNHYSGEIKEKLMAVSNKLNLNIVHVGLPENSVNNVEDYINKTDLVVTLGRGVLESMSCGRNVLVYDIHGADGMVDEGNFFEIRKNNFSGRKYSLKYTNEDLEKELSLYSKKTGLKMRELILKENSIDVILSKLERIYLECVNIKTEKSQIKEGQLFNEINFLEKCFNNLQHTSDFINKSRKEIEELNKALLDKDQEIFTKKKEIENKNQTILQKDTEIEALKNSTSWKITKPVRVIVDIIKKTLSLIRLSLFVLRNDGLVVLLKKINKLVFKKIFRLIKNKYLRIVELFYKSFLIIKKDGLRVFIKKTHLFLRGNKNKKNLQDQYEVWIKQNEDFNVSSIEKEIFDFKYKPKISVITPVYNVDPVWLDKCIESVLNQFYQNWELCLHDDASTKKETIKCLKKWEKKDPRIKISYSKVNQHISGASNEALKLATGEFIALLDNDDELAPHALFENVKVLNEHPDTDFIYSDEDKINREGKRVFPFFKPGWSPDLFYSINYICHLSLMRKAIGDSLGWFRFGFEGAQDYDLFLRFFKKPIKIKHISKILYHWRMLETSTASSIDSKKYANDSGKKALADFIKGSNIKAVVGDGYGETNYRLKFEIPKDKLVSVIILFKDKVDILKICIESILKKTKYKKYELILVSNNSLEKETFQYLGKIKNKKNIKIFKKNIPFNFSKINNWAVSKASGDFIVFLNNDTEVISPEWIDELLMNANRSNVGAVGAMLFYPDNTIQHAGVILGMGGLAGHIFSKQKKEETYFNLSNYTRNYLAVTAACMMIAREKFLEVGGFNESFTVCGNDGDLCLKLYEIGYSNVYTPYAKLYHHESLTRDKIPPLCDYNLSVERYTSYIGNDPYYNNNLSLENEKVDIKTI